MFEKLAFAAPPAVQGGANPIMSFLPLILIFMIFYFLLIRPQQKRQRDLQKMVDNLKKGDRIITSGGVIGTVTGIQDDYVVLKVGDNAQTKIEVLKSAVSGLRKNKD